MTVAARALDSAGVTWTSSATFQASAGGNVDLTTAAPERGSSYAGVDAMGLLWSLTPSKPNAGWVVGPPASEDVVLTARSAGGKAASLTLARLAVAAGVTAQPVTIAGDGLFGVMYSPPPGAGRRPAVLAFGGSEGGLATTLEAALLASHGFPTLALAYFGEPGLPPNLQNVPLEYFTRALGWLRRQPGVDPQHIVVMGDSRGSEAALLLGAHFPDLVHGVVALVPSSTVHAGARASIARLPPRALRGRGAGEHGGAAVAAARRGAAVGGARRAGYGGDLAAGSAAAGVIGWLPFELHQLRACRPAPR